MPNLHQQHGHIMYEQECVRERARVHDQTLVLRDLAIGRCFGTLGYLQDNTLLFQNPCQT